MITPGLPGLPPNLTLTLTLILTLTLTLILTLIPGLPPHWRCRREWAGKPSAGVARE